jgi:hypothetical protein
MWDLPSTNSRTRGGGALFSIFQTEQRRKNQFGIREGVPIAAKVDHLRHSKFAGIRKDKGPRSVAKEHADEP